MSDSSPSSKSSNVFFTAGLFLVFGFLVVILSNFAEQDSLEERAYKGDFDQATIDSRWENLKAIEEVQSTKFSGEKVSKAMAVIASAEAAPAATDVVVPGSPTFMKQMEAAAAESGKPVEKAEAAKPDEGKDVAKAAPKTTEKTDKPEAKAKKAETPKADPPAQR